MAARNKNLLAVEARLKLKALQFRIDCAYLLPAYCMDFSQLFRRYMLSNSNSPFFFVYSVKKNRITDKPVTKCF